MAIAKYFIPVIFLFISIFGYVGGDCNTIRFCVYVLLIYNILSALSDIRANFLFLAFQVTFFTFLLGSDFASLFAQSSELKVNVLDQFNNDTKCHVYFVLYLSLICFFAGYNGNNSNDNFRNYCLSFDINTQYISALRRYSKKFMYVCYVFAVAVELEKLLFVQTVSYVDYYLTYSSHLPIIVVKLGTFYETFFMIYLATLPRYKECKVPILLYAIVSCMTLGYGQRNGVMLSLLFIAFYAMFREKLQCYHEYEEWFSRKRMLAMFASIPFLIVFLYAFNYLRNDLTVDTYKSGFDTMLAFFSQQGGSVQIIGLEKNFSDLHYFPNSHLYSFGSIVDLYQNNFIFKQLGLAPGWEPKSYELAVNGYNFGETMTYLYRPDLYYAGFGLGSCYLAEMFHDFGFIGVIVINLLYGYILKRISSFDIKNVWYLFVFLIILTNILYAPRAGALSFVNAFFSVSITGLAFIMHLLVKNKK